MLDSCKHKSIRNCNARMQKKYRNGGGMAVKIGNSGCAALKHVAGRVSGGSEVDEENCATFC